MRSRGSLIPSRWVGLLVALAVCLGGCSLWRVERPLEVVHGQGEWPSVETLRERAARSFERAVFYKPSDESLSAPQGALAPLLVQRVAGRMVSTEGFGAIVGDAREVRIDAASPTIFVKRGSTRVGSSELEQWTYFWRYPSACGSGRCASCTGHGVRVTLGVEGLPLVWEALSTEDNRRILFVSLSLEEAATQEFGDPLPGRTFSIERAVEDARQVVVVRLLEDASVAMGPYVYLDAAPGANVTAVLCRCMPSQVDEFVETRYYNLVPQQSLPPSLCGHSARFALQRRIRWSGTMDLYDLQHGTSSTESLERILRWPTEYR